MKSRTRRIPPQNQTSNRTPQRQQARLAKDRGILAMKAARQGRGMSIVEWCQMLDPLFKIKGQLRHDIMQTR